MEHLKKKDQLLFIKLCIENQNIPDLNDDWLCDQYNAEHIIFEELNQLFYKLFGNDNGIFIGCECKSYLAEHWPDNLIRAYRERCECRRK